MIGQTERQAILAVVNDITEGRMKEAVTKATDVLVMTARVRILTRAREAIDARVTEDMQDVLEAALHAIVDEHRLILEDLAAFVLHLNGQSADESVVNLINSLKEKRDDNE